MIENDIGRARSALLHLDAGCARDEWVRIGMAAKVAGLDLIDWIDWCASGSNYGGEREAASVWRSFKASGGVGAASLFKAAIDSGWTDSSTAAVKNRAPVVHTPEVAKRPRLADNWQAYWDGLGEVRKDGKSYLVARRCVIPPQDGGLRYDPAARHPSGFVGPSLVALVTDALDCSPISLHRTWVKADGTKADVDKPKLMLGDNHRKSGGVVRLWPDDAVCYGLGIAEGIETALALAHSFKPVWSAIDAGNLAKFPVIAYVDCLTIAVDNDPAGKKDSRICAERWAAEGRSVQILECFTSGADVNDLVLEVA